MEKLLEILRRGVKIKTSAKVPTNTVYLVGEEGLSLDYVLAADENTARRIIDRIGVKVPENVVFDLPTMIWLHRSIVDTEPRPRTPDTFPPHQWRTNNGPTCAETRP